MKTHELQQVRPGFHDTALGSQAVFRTALSALSHPGRVIERPDVCALPRHGHAAAAMLLLALVDSDCSVWLSPSLAGTDAAAWLRFHTGCHWAASAETAGFLWVAEGDAAPALHTLDAGSDHDPDRSATCVIEVRAMGEAVHGDSLELCLQGPGIATVQPLAVQGLPLDFCAQWQANHQRFPRGVDLFFCSPSHLAGLPRSTRLRTTEEA